MSYIIEKLHSRYLHGISILDIPRYYEELGI